MPSGPRSAGSRGQIHVVGRRAAYRPSAGACPRRGRRRSRTRRARCLGDSAAARHLLQRVRLVRVVERRERLAESPLERPATGTTSASARAAPELGTHERGLAPSGERVGDVGRPRSGQLDGPQLGRDRTVAVGAEVGRGASAGRSRPNSSATSAPRARSDRVVPGSSSRLATPGRPSSCSSNSRALAPSSPPCAVEVEVVLGEVREHGDAKRTPSTRRARARGRRPP